MRGNTYRYVHITKLNTVAGITWTATSAAVICFIRVHCTYNSNVQFFFAFHAFDLCRCHSVFSHTISVVVVSWSHSLVIVNYDIEAKMRRPSYVLDLKLAALPLKDREHKFKLKYGYTFCFFFILFQVNRIHCTRKPLYHCLFDLQKLKTVVMNCCYEWWTISNQLKNQKNNHSNSW